MRFEGLEELGGGPRFKLLERPIVIGRKDIRRVEVCPLRVAGSNRVQVLEYGADRVDTKRVEEQAVVALNRWLESSPRQQWTLATRRACRLSSEKGFAEKVLAHYEAEVQRTKVEPAHRVSRSTQCPVGTANASVASDSAGSG